MDWITHNKYTLTVQVDHKGTPIDLASVTAQLPAELASRPADLFDAFAEMLRAGADRLDTRRVLPSTFIPPGMKVPAASTTFTRS